MKPVPSSKKDQIRNLLSQGHSVREIEKKVGVSKSSISRIKNSYFPNQKKLTGGRPIKFSERDRRRIVSLVNSKDFDNAEQVTKFLNSNTNQKVSSNTVRKALKQEGYVSRLKKKKPKLTFGSKEEKNEFCQFIQNLDF